MGSKAGVAGGIPERRVRPIWDAVDSRQFKSALKHSSALLSKYPNSPYALGLKALILERMGKGEEALSVCINAKDILCKDESVLIDDLTLSTLQIVFQRLDHLELATSCYEYACAKFPKNIDLMMGLFNCYVREYSFVKQQQTAIKMYKHAGEERFLLWAVCSVQLQVLCGKGGEKLLLLAEGLLKKHISEHGLNDPEVLIVYLSILERQSKYGEAMEIISGKLGSLLPIECDKLRIKGKLLAYSGDYAAASDVYQQILIQCPDDWECFLQYLGCLCEDGIIWNKKMSGDFYHSSIEFGCKSLQLSDDVFDSRISAAQSFVHKLLTDPSTDSLRLPYLATLEIWRRKHLFGKVVDKDITNSLMDYYLKFGHLACYISDVEAFVKILNGTEKRNFLEQIRNSNSSLGGEPSKILGRLMTIFRVQELIGRTEIFSTSELCESAVDMMELYCNNLKLSKDLEPQENVFGEDLLTMVCNVLIKLFIRTKQLGFFVEAVMVLEFGLTIRRHVWQYKVHLLHLYSYFGATASAYDSYKSMDVKNILMETVLHNILPQMLGSPFWNDSSNLLNDCLRFMEDHLRESADLTFLAFRHKTYSKVIEFVLFKEKLQDSNQYLTAKIESSILILKQKADDIGEEEGILESIDFGSHLAKLSNEIQLKNLTFNEDLSTRPWWTPNPHKNFLSGTLEDSQETVENLKKEMEENVRILVNRKSLLPRMIYLSIKNSSACFKEIIDPNGSVGDSENSSDFKHLLEEYAKTFSFSLNDAIRIIHQVSDGSKSSEVFGSDLVDWLNFAVFLNAWNLNSREIVSDSGRSLWHVVSTLLGNCVSDLCASAPSFLSFSSSDLSILIRVVTEPLAWHGLVIQSCIRSSQPAGKKKKKGTQTLDIRDSILSLRAAIERVSNWCREQLRVSEEENLNVLLSSVRTGQQTESPGQILSIIDRAVSSVDEQLIGQRIAESLRSWNFAKVATKMVTGRSKVLAEFLRICDSKLKALATWNKQLGMS